MTVYGICWTAWQRTRLSSDTPFVTNYPRKIPRKGSFPAPASQIFGVTFGQDAGSYVEQHLVRSDYAACLGRYPKLVFLQRALDAIAGPPHLCIVFGQRSKTSVSQWEATRSHRQGQNKARALKICQSTLDLILAGRTLSCET